jgi:hypothetical protein
MVQELLHHLQDGPHPAAIIPAVAGAGAGANPLLPLLLPWLLPPLAGVAGRRLL